MGSLSNLMNYNNNNIARRMLAECKGSLGAIDGFSRFIIYLHCSNNNESTTVLSCFRDGVQQHGLPLRVRGDQGRENVKVCTKFIRIHHACAVVKTNMSPTGC